MPAGRNALRRAGVGPERRHEKQEKHAPADWAGQQGSMAMPVHAACCSTSSVDGCRNC